MKKYNQYNQMEKLALAINHMAREDKEFNDIENLTLKEIVNHQIEYLER